MILILIDGLSVEFAEKYFELPLDMTVKDTWFPSLTGCVHLSLLTGKTPGENNIPGMRWMDRVTGQKRTYFNLTGSVDGDYVGRTFLDGNGSSLSIQSPVNCGFTKRYLPLGHVLSHGLNTWELFDKKAFKDLEKNPGFDFKLLCLYSVDELSHRFGMYSQRVKDACVMLNKRLDKVFKKHQDEDIIVLSDHGLSETKRHINLIKELSKRGFKTRGFPFYMGSQDVFVAVSGNSMAHVYLKNKAQMDKIILTLEDIKGVDKIYTHDEARTDLIFTSQRCGDIVVTSEPGVDLRTWEFPEHKASHGSNCPEHYKVPFYSNRKTNGPKISIPGFNRVKEPHITSFEQGN